MASKPSTGGRPAAAVPAAPAHGHAHKEPGFVRKYIFSLDHKMIGKQFWFSCCFFFLIGGLLALAVRWQLAWPGTKIPLFQFLPDTMAANGVVLPDFYNILFTMHASIMIFFVVIPFLNGAFGNFLIPLMIGAEDMAFPALNMMSFWVWLAGALIATAGFFVPGGAGAAGWTSYPPLSETLGLGQTLWIVGVIVAGTGSIMGALNYITTITNMRAKGLSWFRLPLSIWAFFITSILSLLATPVLASALALLLMDRTAGTSFFMPAGQVIAGVHLGHQGGQPLLFQHLFWFYSHPAVYIMILPGMGMVSDVIATFARRAIFGYRAMIYSISAIAGLGFIVWGHHMFQSGMNPLLGTAFQTSTMFIAVPSAIKTFNWLGTVWGGNNRYTTAMCFAISFVAMFVIGGLSGVFMASTPVDIFIHDTYFIVAHLHYVLFAGSLMAVFAAIYYWFPKMFSRHLHEGWGKVHFWLTFIGLNGVFFPMHILGMGGMMRRIYDPTQYSHFQHLQGINIGMTWSAFVLGAAQVIFAINMFASLRAGRKAAQNPWHANSLEWAAPTPPPHGNFPVPPTVYRGPYEFSSPERKEDYWPQTEPPEPSPGERKAAPATA